MRRFTLILLALTGAGLAVGGLVPEGAPIPAPGQAGAPHRILTATEQAQFLRGRAVFDHDFGTKEGVGPHFNGDSCRACHRDPVIGGAGGIDVQVQRPIMMDGSAPVETGGIAQTHAIPGADLEQIPADVRLVEERNSPTLLGLGLVEGISEQAIRDGEGEFAAEGIFGVAHILADDSVGRLGWKANFPDLRAFLRDAMENELGITVPADPTSPFGIEMDADGVQDPEVNTQDFDDVLFFMQLLDFAPKLPPTTQTMEGEQLFNTVGCAKCHKPMLDGVELYSNLLLHDVLPDDFDGVAQGNADVGLYRTAPLRGLRDTAPYFHDGRSWTVDDAIRRHEGEASDVEAAYEALTDEQEAALLAFLNSL